LLREWSSGDVSALERLVPLVYADLRRIAEHHLRGESSGNTLQPTALINEAFLRLLDQHSLNWESRTHFFGAAAELMRRILVDYARRRAAEKRGAAFMRVEMTEAEGATGQISLDFMAVDEALTRLAAVDGQLARVVELRFFGGLSVDETAKVLGISSATVKREWALAKAWLLRKMAKA
jgi:RNA polymerase sigma factor (TIGR02999 family)